MSPQRIAGLALIVLGVILLIVRFNASDSIADRLSNFFTGKFTDSTVWYLVGGAASAIVGVLLVIVGGRRAGA